MPDNFFPVIDSAQGESVRRPDIDEIKRRFELLRQMRLQRIQAFLQPRQRMFLDVLPLIFHQNLPSLPGFISLETPADIAGFTPSGPHLHAARKLSKSFLYGSRLGVKTAIEGLFLMGSVSSMAFSGTSDMDIWLCYQSDLSAQEVGELKKKADAVEKWAAFLNLEVHFFLMDSARFRGGETLPLSRESSGKTQRYLLLEEFYRTAVPIAGKSPAWWFVPPHHAGGYREYIDALIAGGALSGHEIIDFGGLDEIPADEFVSATFWHIYKSLEAPHKSLLKLLLTECYAREYPRPKWLCEEIKQAIYQGTFNSVDLDPYFLIYRKVENYLRESGQDARIDLIRHCFYLKTMGASGHAKETRGRAIKAGYLDKVSREQGWPAEILARLNAAGRWDIKKTVQEHNQILQQLSQCFRLLAGFAKMHIGSDHHRGNVDQKLIGRKLYSFLEKRPGKIEILTTRRLLAGREEELSVVETAFDNGAQGWSLFAGRVGLADAPAHAAVQQFRHLAELLCWLAGNRIYHRSRPIYFNSAALVLGAHDLHALLGSLDAFFGGHVQPDTPLEAYRTARKQRASLIIINLGLPSIEITGNDSYVISERSDVLSYGPGRQCFVQTVDKISVSSWNEITASHYFGIEGLFNALTEILNSHGRPLAEDRVALICQTPMRASSIVLRIASVFAILRKVFGGAEAASADRFIVAGENFYYLFYDAGGSVNFKMLATAEQVLAELSRPQAAYSAVCFDQGVLEATPIPTVYAFNKPRAVQVFYRVRRGGVRLYVLDERGSLFTCRHEKADPAHLLYQYSQFLDAVLTRAVRDDLGVEYYEIVRDAPDSFACAPVDVKPPAAAGGLVVRIAGEITQTGIRYTIYCNEREFSAPDGDALFAEVHRYIHRFRDRKSDYPVYISDLDLPFAAFNINSPEQLQTVHYLTYKQKIESRFIS